MRLISLVLTLWSTSIAQGLLAQNEKIELPVDFGTSRKRRRTSVAADETEYLDAMLDDLHSLETTYVFSFSLSWPTFRCPVDRLVTVLTLCPEPQL